ncbi:MAG: hypothetical protein HQ501_08165 [Rhodospirillales bacterium]|nr:hypothetical protein [Rhodospirillales bacterium]
MKPMLRTIRVEDQARLLAEHIDAKDAPRLPPEMENRPDAAELRAFIRNFRRIGSAEDRRAVMDAVMQEADGGA